RAVIVMGGGYRRQGGVRQARTRTPQAKASSATLFPAAAQCAAKRWRFRSSDSRAPESRDSLIHSSRHRRARGTDSGSPEAASFPPPACRRLGGVLPPL